MRPPEQKRARQSTRPHLRSDRTAAIEDWRELSGSRGGEAERLAAIGLVRPGSAPKTIACRACDEDHSATPEFDSIAGRYFHFCPIAGRVDIEPRDLGTFEIRATGNRRSVGRRLSRAARYRSRTRGRKSLAPGRGGRRRNIAHADLCLSNWKPTGFRCAGESGRRGAGDRNRNDLNEQPAARSTIDRCQIATRSSASATSLASRATASRSTENASLPISGCCAGIRSDFALVAAGRRMRT